MRLPTGRLAWGGLLLGLSLALGALDWWSGNELNFFVFYYAPVSLAAWFMGRSDAVVFAVLCALIWFAADLLSGHVHSTQLLAVWNTMIHLVAFLAIGGALSLLRHTLERERERAAELRTRLAQIRVLEAFLPICAQCKKIRDEAGAWQPIERYISSHSDTRFSHGFCPDCYQRALVEAGLRAPEDPGRAGERG
jgi:hypothetical protein